MRKRNNEVFRNLTPLQIKNLSKKIDTCAYLQYHFDVDTIQEINPSDFEPSIIQLRREREKQERIAKIIKEKKWLKNQK